ncbi:unannotated protein [freshwater metagenome]|uniref:Unannotated protein n=1 Tax=freshwater metagenome TaxID=449393 RepID=A0A6J6XYJ2_9ZZZZ
MRPLAKILPSGPAISRAASGSNSPITSSTPAARRDLPPSARAVTAPASTITRPAAARANAIQSFRPDRRSWRGSTVVPIPDPLSAEAITPGVDVAAMTVRTPDQDAIFAAPNLLAIPPLPLFDPAPPATASNSASTETISSIREASASRRGSAVYRPSVSVRRTSVSALIMFATRAARRSLSP